MTAIDYDTEFIESGGSSPILLLSIGMIRDDGATYYAVVDDRDAISLALMNPWLAENVIPSLPIQFFVGGQRWTWAVGHRDYSAVKPRRQIAAEVAEFITSVPDPRLWAWYAAYDHVVLAQLFGRMIDLPKGVPMWTNDLKQEAERLGNPALPSLAGITEHNALDDAREVQYRRRWLAGYEGGPAPSGLDKVAAAVRAARGGPAPAQIQGYA